MASFGFQRSANKVVQGGHFIYEQLIAQNAITPGALVIRDTDDEHVSEAGANATDVQGVADVVFTERRGQTSREGQEVGTDIPADEAVRVAKGVFLFRGLLADEENVTKGQRFGAAANGELAAATTGNPVYGWFEETVDNTGTPDTAAPVLAMFCPGEVNL